MAKGRTILAFAKLDVFPIEYLLSEVHKTARERSSVYLNHFRKHQFLLGQYLLTCLYKKYFSDLVPTINYTMSGRPFFVSSDVEFSISHSKSLVVCGISALGHIGVDVERINPERNWQGIAKAFFHRAEVKSISESGTPTHLFYNHWVVKESLLKLTDQGLHRITDVFVDIENNIIKHPFSLKGLTCWLATVDEHVCSICLEYAGTAFYPICVALTETDKFSNVDLQGQKFQVNCF